jgi:hypothetical protein
MSIFLCGPGTPSARDISAFAQMRSDLSMPLDRRQSKWLQLWRLIERQQLNPAQLASVCSCPDDHCVVHGKMPPATLQE